MFRGEAFGLKNKYFEIFQCQILNISMKKKVRPLDGSVGRAFCLTQTLLERPNSWRHNFLKVLPPRILWTLAFSVKAERTDFGHWCIFFGPNASPLEIWP